MYTTYFTVFAHSDPQTVARVLNPFTQRALVPLHLEASSEGGHISIKLVITDLDQEPARLIAQKIAALFLVIDVSWRCEFQAANASIAA